MAKYTVAYACGHGEHTIELFGKNKDRESKLEWYEKSVVCPDCYKKKMQKEAKEKGLQLIVDVVPFGYDDTPVLLHFDGDTMPHKDEIKALGYHWGELPATGALGMLSTRNPQKAWHKFISVSDLEKSIPEEFKKAEQIGTIKIINNITAIDIVMCQQVNAKRAEKQAKIEAIPKPKCPKKLVGATWNGTIYGRKGNYSYYNKGIKIELTNDEAEDIKQYVSDKAEYKKKVAEIQ